VRIEEGEFEKYGIRSSRESVTPMGPSERKFFNLRQVEEGYRLSCQALIQDDVVVFVPEESRMGKQVVRKAPTSRPIEIKPIVRKYALELVKATLHDNVGDWERLTAALETQYGLTQLTIDYEVLMSLQDLVRQGEWKITVSIWHNKEVIRVEPGFNPKGYGLAVDVGTSTVAGYLCDLSDGTVVATASMMNPQIVYGEDVMSRISYTMTNADGLEILNQAIIDGLNNIVAEVSERAGIKRQDILDMSLVGNTCMHHIYLNINPRYIGRSPFAPSLHHSLDVKARDFGFKIPQEKEREEKGKYAPCRVACPAGVNVDDFLYLMAQKKFKEALELVRLSYPFAGVCGRVCTHPCEGICERGKVDHAVSIRAAHRFLADWEGAGGRPAAAAVPLKKEAAIAVIGSGPGGLSCAYDLINRGYPVTVFEAQPQAGGMMRYGIPEYRLPKNILEDEIRLIEELGVSIKTNSPVSDLESLFSEGFKAVFLATGTWKSQSLNIAGEDHPQVLKALDLLKAVNSGEPRTLSGTVAVIGGGSVAIDAARTARRLGAREVHLICLESTDLTCQDRMPAQDLEIDQAQEEGVIIHPSLGISAIVIENEQLKGVETVGCVSVYDDQGRFSPRFSEETAPFIPVDSVIVAVGQRADDTLFPGLSRTASGTVQVDPQTLETSRPGVFAGGDGAAGPGNVIRAIRDGKEAAISIELFLSGKDMKEDRPKALKAVEEIPKEGIRREDRQKEAELPMEGRQGFAEVELGLDESQVVPESIRCLHCAVFAQKEETEEKEARGWGIKISPGAYVHCLPIEAGFVGADNVGVLIAEAPYNQDSLDLIIDIGTNGEIILGNRQRLISASCATGPAFEGAQLRYGMRAAPGAIEKIEIDKETQEVRFKVIDESRWNTEMKPEEIKAKGICGSGIIDAIPQLFLAGIIDKTGKFNKDIQNPRLRYSVDQYEYVIAWADETSIGQDVVVCQDDIRAIQLGKAAMYAGSKILMETLGIDKVDRVILAGAFGSYIDKLSAAILGMFPDCDPKNVFSVGNAAGDGARMALLNADKRKEADEYARKVEYIELTISPKFEKIFAHSMWLPHMKDAFPNLAQHLPPKK
jgi:uncharacterized 2Fe-2S/4Fe-4S cluster protein (DUF4445 family)/NADPH-dependent glutamate synthase beta subunit-like oxidoreductase